jgi:hypothetical protein
MKFAFLLAFPVVLLSLCGFSQQASLTIINKSDRVMTTKVIKGTERNSELHKTVTIAPKKTEVIYFSMTGRYFTKTMAVLISKDTLTLNDTLYSKGTPFEVIADSKRGYSNITMKFIVKESKKPILDGSFPITRKEFEDD